MTWPESAKMQVGFRPYHHGFWLEAKYQGRSYAVWVSRRQPETLANTFTVKRIWNENIAFASSAPGRIRSLGCREVQRFSYRCEAVSASKSPGHFAAESLIWNAKSDLVLIRVMSTRSTEDAQKLLRALQIEMKNTVPGAGHA